MVCDPLPKYWKWTTLGAVADFINGDRGQNYPTQSDRVRTGVPFINTGHIEVNGRLTNVGMDYITRDSFERLRSGKVKQGDIVYCLRGSTIGKTALNHFAEGAIASSLVIVRAKANVYQEYLYFYLRSPLGRQLVAQHDNGSAQPNLSVRSLSNYPLPLPPIDVQRAIASLLGALDDKIELNRQMNETLEATARLFFKDWFVDFGPTRAKAEGRPPYLAPELWTLFPDALDDDDKPMGWKSARLGDIAEAKTRTVDPIEVEPETPYIGLEHMPRRSIAINNWEGAGKVTSGKLGFKKGELLFGKLRPYFHKVGIAPIEGICSTDIVVCKSKHEIGTAFVLSLISSDEFVAYTDQTSTGTKMPRTSWSLMARYEITRPPELVLEAFNHLLMPWIQLINVNIHESNTLIQTRNLLLPKLISGKICLRDAEKMVEAVT